MSLALDFSKLSEVVKNDVAKKGVYNAKLKNIEVKIPDMTNLATNTTLTTKINEFENQIPKITNLATATAFTADEKKPNISNLVQKITITQKSMKLNIKLRMIIIIINILLFKNFIS